MFAVAMVLVVPVAVMFGGAIWSALFGWLAERRRRTSALRGAGATPTDRDESV